MAGTSRRGKAFLAFYCLVAGGLAALFQNCAPAGSFPASAEAASAAEAPVDDFPVSVIDPVNETTGLSFRKAEYEAPEDGGRAVVLVGQCDPQQNGATLRWTMRDPSGLSPIAEDQATCQDGEFRLRIPPQLFPSCNGAYEVEARLGLGAPGEATLRRPCDAI